MNDPGSTFKRPKISGNIKVDLCVCVCVCVCVCLVTQLCPTLCDPMEVAHQAPLSMEFSRQEYWSGLSFTTPGDLPNLGIEPISPVSSALAAGFSTTEPPEKPITCYIEL